VKNYLKAKSLLVISSILLISACGSGSDPLPAEEVVIIPESPVITTPVELTTVVDGTEVETAALISLGEQIFNDTNLSSPSGQACATCHNLSAGFDDTNNTIPTSIGADGFSFGARNSPTASYAAHIPEPQTVNRPPPGGGQDRAVLIGGLFLDGRAATLEEQAKGPFLNPTEMANGTREELIEKLRLASYAADFELLFGEAILDDVDRSFDYIADALAAFERTEIFSPFSSKFDRVENETDNFTASELRGRQLFGGRAQCDRCHLIEEQQSQFSDFEFHNIGVPSNIMVLAAINDPQFIDLGLGGVTEDPRDDGKFRTSTLRNIAITAPYMHNGIFTTLTEVVEFYNSRDTTFSLTAEVERNLDQGGNIGELELSDNDIVDLVAFLETLTDQ